jgi:hypothetical protein
MLGYLISNEQNCRKWHEYSIRAVSNRKEKVIVIASIEIEDLVAQDTETPPGYITPTTLVRFPSRGTFSPIIN